MSVNLKHVEEVEKLQLEIQKLSYENKELLSIIKSYKEVYNQQAINFNIMVEQRDSLLQLAKNLDMDFNQGKIFNKDLK